MKEEEVIYKSVSDFAKAKGVSTQTVYNWQSEGLIVFENHEKYAGWVINWNIYNDILPRKRGVKTLKETLASIENKEK